MKKEEKKIMDRMERITMRAMMGMDRPGDDRKMAELRFALKKIQKPEVK